MWRLLRVTRSIFERTLMCGSSSMTIVLKHCMHALRNLEASTANCKSHVMQLRGITLRQMGWNAKL